MRLIYRKSAIGYPKDQRDTIRALGFTRLNQVVERPDTPSVRGMVYKVRHLVLIEGEGVINGSAIHRNQSQ
ncbi:MAG TPA: 50S ribosomal protein L30 [Thermomicrobiales bacterium]|nr:50S ribosomal protein L30 [Thermomicrobiales bacterium]HRA31140.1 50S ribosomal protein L30 [Thermomicrobiales bacterium]